MVRVALAEKPVVVSVERKSHVAELIVII